MSIPVYVSPVFLPLLPKDGNTFNLTMPLDRCRSSWERAVHLHICKTRERKAELPIVTSTVLSDKVKTEVEKDPARTEVARIDSFLTAMCGILNQSQIWQVLETGANHYIAAVQGLSLGDLFLTGGHPLMTALYFPVGVPEARFIRQNIGPHLSVRQIQSLFLPGMSSRNQAQEILKKISAIENLQEPLPVLNSANSISEALIVAIVLKYRLDFFYQIPCPEDSEEFLDYRRDSYQSITHDPNWSDGSDEETIQEVIDSGEYLLKDLVSWRVDLLEASRDLIQQGKSEYNQRSLPSPKLDSLQTKSGSDTQTFSSEDVQILFASTPSLSGFVNTNSWLKSTEAKPAESLLGSVAGAFTNTSDRFKKYSAIAAEEVGRLTEAFSHQSSSNEDLGGREPGEAG